MQSARSRDQPDDGREHHQHHDPRLEQGDIIAELGLGGLCVGIQGDVSHHGLR